MKQKRFILFLCIGLFLLSLAVVQAEAKKRTVIFDQGHGQKFVVENEGDLNRDGKFNETDARQSFGVIIAGTLGKGSYVIFGDDAIFQNKFLDQENMSLGKNLAAWMK